MKLNNFKNIFYVSLALHFFAAIFSSGFQHFDEHFQIYEFLNLKLGGTDSSNLPWEYREQIRPWFQVYVYFILHKGFSLIGIKSPFIIATLFRIITSMFGLFALTRIIPLLKIWIKSEKHQILTWGFLNFCWFVPYIQTRTNSESFGISFFLWGLSLFVIALEKNEKLVKAGLLSGLLFGLAYLSRSQMAFCVAFLWFWAIIIKRAKISFLASSAFTILVAIGLGVFFDYWGYGNWTFSTWHYFRTNFVEGIMSNVQQYPWWWYFRLCITRGIAPVSLPLTLVTVWGWYKYRKHPVTWATLPLFIFHCYVGHKELRYIFPIIIIAPIYLGFFVRDYSEKIGDILKKTWGKILWKFVVGVNILFLMVGTFRAANPAVNFYSFVWKNEQIKEINVHGENPFTMLGLKLEYYKKKELIISDVRDVKTFLDGLTDEKYLFFNKGRFVMEMESNSRCTLKYLTYPRWLLNFNVGNWISRSRVWSLYLCK